jgi:parallel beta-helix repeat protein
MGDVAAARRVHQRSGPTRESRIMSDHRTHWFSVPGCLGAVAALGLAGGSHQASAAVACGEVVRGAAALEQNLTCATEPALTVRGHLNLNGFSVSCQGTEAGVVLDGRGASLRNGLVTGCVNAVVLVGAGRHLVTDVTADATSRAFSVESAANRLLGNRGTGASDAFRVSGRNNLLSANTAISPLDDGFDVRGLGNLMVRNLVTGAGGEGFDITTPGNWILSNTVSGAADDGMQVRTGGNRVVGNTITDGSRGILVQESDAGAAEGNEILGNTVLDNQREGIVVDLGSTRNRIVGNQALGNDIDLRDLHPDCDDNLWKGNVFDTAEPEDCID